MRSMSSHNDQLYLHVAPCGDYWTGHEVFAAKHLQPDYVKSIPIPKGLNVEDILDDLNDGEDIDGILKNVYDTEDITLIEKLSSNDKRR
eukprot:CAMPEP_0194111998 /NCGR_PEP_ID=MMETSP0150-20130528/10862_1 /TAXON_ID=122233 /ORGANISM="Chaetoceros debilis, Strain MM31A-1" /LENGTH=88 /DNA_ID=CAMNT_0038801563 /DNA_START=55 /DNA_END=321 /DNA_ORIENTATION=-